MVKIDGISSIYVYKTSRLTWTHPDNLDLFCLAYQVSGNYEHKFPGETLTVKENSLFFITKRTPYSVKCLEQGEAICVTFTAETDLPASVYDCGEYPEIKGLFQKLLNYKNLQSNMNCCEAMAIIYRVLSFIYRRRQPSYLASSNRTKVQLAFDYLTEHYTESGLKVSDVADSFDMGAKHFRNLFQSLYHTLPSQYLISLRLQTAIKLLEETHLTLSEISEVSGFCDVCYFSKLFKAKLSCTPKEYRERHRNRVTVP